MTLIWQYLAPLDSKETAAMSLESTPDLILSAQLSDREITRILLPVGFATTGEAVVAHRCLLRLADIPHARDTVASLLPHLLLTLADRANPDRVLVSLERFVRGADDSLDMLRYLADNPRAVEILIALFAGSQFLTEILLRSPEYLELLVTHRLLARPKTLDQFCDDAQACTLASPGAEPASLVEQLNALRRFQRWELLRIGACDLLDLFDLRAVTQQLSHLADSTVRASLDIAAGQSGISADGFIVVGMGKLGGGELNYSSDIDLLFVAREHATSYLRLGERLIDAVTRVTGEGFLYRVDMRLRPWGQVGALVTSVDGYVTYLEKHARQWEKQALLKARLIAGDEALGNAFLKRIEPLLFRSDAQSIRSQVYAMKHRTEGHLRKQGRAWGEVKLGEGSIRDVEFVTQYLQLSHGLEHAQIRSRNTLEALRRLSAHGLLQIEEQRVLADGYTFLRTIEHHLQMMHYRQTHTLPEDAPALAQLARRLGFQGDQAGEQFITRYEQHRAAIRAIYLRHLGGSDMTEPASDQASSSDTSITRHLARMDPAYSTAFGDQEIDLHATLAEHLDQDHLVDVHAIPLEKGLYRATVVAYDYPGELSLICGLLFVYGFSIVDGDVFTYEPEAKDRQTEERARPERRKIVDAFTVKPVRGEVTADTWTRYAEDLAALLKLMHDGQRREARGRLAKRVAEAVQDVPVTTAALYPIEIEIDNTASEAYTVLYIDSPDTIGFLYEFANALALNRIYIARVRISSVGNRVHDTLYVTDAAGRKITSADKQREVRAATVLTKHFTHLLPHSPNPESALLHFREFIGQLFQRPDWADELASLEKPQVLDALARLLGVSDFLWDDFLRMQHANLFPVVRDIDALDTVKTREQLQAELEAELLPIHDGPQPPADNAPWRNTLNAFKDREMFRIDMRHILGHTREFGEFSKELTDLAEVVVNSAYHLCHEDLRTVYGTPCLSDGSISEMTVLALGKCGGQELGFASDIELMFVYSANGRTTGSSAITTAEFYEKVVQTLVSAIRAKQEGIFEIDLRLRPYGKAGSMAVSLEAFRRYFHPDGPAWAYERQALVKLRPIAGSPELGRQVVALRDQFVYTGQAFDTTAMRAMRERQIRHLVTGGTFNAKYSPGGLVDVEYLVQGLQITHGHNEPRLRQTNIREAMASLVQTSLLSEEDYTQLRKAHTFLRWLIDALRMVRGNARDLTVPPAGSEAFAFLARRLRYGSSAAELRADLEHYTSGVQDLSARLLPP
jgi:glutamate-ammonia-ligase adenylyltransferase